MSFKKKTRNALFYKAVGAPPGSGFVGKLSQKLSETNTRRTKVIPRRNPPHIRKINTIVFPITDRIKSPYV